MDIVLGHLGETRLPVVLLGHFNAKHSEWFVGDSSNDHGRILKDLIDRPDMHQLVSQPTHLNIEGKPSSLLDLIFTNTPHFFSSSAEVMAPVTTSDYLPVVIECSIARTYIHPVVGDEYTKWHYALKDVGKMEDTFLYDRDSWEYVFQPYNDINEIWNGWKSAFFNDIESFIPKSTRKSKKNHLSSPWFSKKLRCLFRRKINYSNSKER